MQYQFKDQMITSEDDLTALTGTELVELYNEVTGESLKKFADKATAVSRIAPILEQIAPPIKEPVTRGGAGRRSSIHPDSIIEVLVDENPKRGNAASRARFELYTSGMTVSDYRAKGGLLADIRWDKDHDFISVTAPE